MHKHAALLSDHFQSIGDNEQLERHFSMQMNYEQKNVRPYFTYELAGA